MKHIVLPTLAALLSCAAPATAASTYLETFSNDGNDEGWFQVSNGSAPSLAQDPGTDRLAFAASDASLFYIAADAAASGGAFVGDYVAAGVYQFTFDLTIDALSSVTGLYFELTNLTEGETWQYALALPSFGTDTSYTVPLGGAGWTQTSGDENFAFILGQTEEIGVALSAGAPGVMAGSIDNIAAVPEPSAAFIAALGLLTAATRRRR